MVLAKVTSKGQVTVPVEIRKKLNISDGNKILFYENEQGQVIIENANVSAFHNIKNLWKVKQKKRVSILMKEIRGNK